MIAVGAKGQIALPPRPQRHKASRLNAVGILVSVTRRSICGRPTTDGSPCKNSSGCRVQHPAPSLGSHSVDAGKAASAAAAESMPSRDADETRAADGDGLVRCPIGKERGGIRCNVEEINVSDIVTSDDQEQDRFAGRLAEHYGTARESWPHCRTHNMIADLDMSSRALRAAEDIRIGDVIDDGLGSATITNIETEQRGGVALVLITWGDGFKHGYPTGALLPIHQPA